MPGRTGYKVSIECKERVYEAIRLKVEEKLGKFNGCRSRDTEQLVESELTIGLKQWQHFVEASHNINREVFKRICAWLDLPWEEIVASPSEPLVPSDTPFYGRTKELNDLKRWVTNIGCRMVTVHGFDGMGKSSLVRELIKEKPVRESFQRCEWEPFSYGDSVESTLLHLLQRLDLQTLPSDLSLEQIKRTFRDRLQQQRYLIVLEQIPDGRTGRYDNYSMLLSELLEPYGKHHSSCILLITSHERHDGLTDVANHSAAVQRLSLTGVDNEAGLDILRNREPNLVIDLEVAAQLVKLFQGYPSALRHVSSHIQDHYEGNVRNFLKDPSIPTKVETIIKRLIDDLESSTRNILDILKDYDEPISQAQLRSAYSEKNPDIRNFTMEINILLRRSLLVRDEGDTDYGKAYFYSLEAVTKQVLLALISRY
jgi:NB-ARC domain